MGRGALRDHIAMAIPRLEVAAGPERIVDRGRPAAVSRGPQVAGDAKVAGGDARQCANPSAAGENRCGRPREASACYVIDRIRQRMLGNRLSKATRAEMNQGHRRCDTAASRLNDGLGAARGRIIASCCPPKWRVGRADVSFGGIGVTCWACPIGEHDGKRGAGRHVSLLGFAPLQD